MGQIKSNLHLRAFWSFWSTWTMFQQVN